MNKKIYISTGEVSGDLHGELLSKALFAEAKKTFNRFGNHRTRRGKNASSGSKNSKRYYFY